MAETGLTLHKANELVEGAKRVRKSAERIREHANEVVHRFVRTTEVSSASFLWGLLQGRYGNLNFKGVPLELGGGIAMHLGGLLFNIAPEHLAAFGDGSLASYFHSVGRGAGLEWWVRAGKPARALGKGTVSSEVTETTVRGASAPSDEDLARQIRAAAR